VRLLELELSAFGALRHRKLDFSQPGPQLHLLYGPNETGKSTTLRAILGLLYGIDHQSPDARVFGPDNLRITARLCNQAGVQLIATRVKGRKTSLRGQNDEPLDEAALACLLGELPYAVFKLMFGLDHERLREGGEQLRLGRGALGESLFEAGFGGSGVQRVLHELRGEAEALFKPSGRLPPLNEAIRAYRDASRRSREASTRAESFRIQQEQLEHVRHRAHTLQEQRNERLSEQGRLRRVLRALPGLAKRRELLARKALLGDAVSLPEDAADARRSVQAELRGYEREAAGLAASVAKLRAELVDLSIPQSLAELHPEVLRGVRNRLGNHLKAIEDLPRRRAQLRVLQSEANEALRELGNPAALSEVEQLRVDRASQAHVAELASEYGALAERVAAAERERAAIVAEMDHLAAETEARTEALDLVPLAQALVQARSAGDLERQSAQLAGELQNERQRCEAMLDLLGLSGIALQDLSSIPWPSELAVAEYRRRLERQDHEAARLAQQALELDQRERRVAHDLSRIEHEGAPPTERDLQNMRTERGRRWQRVRELLTAQHRLEQPGKAPPEALAEFERALRDADDMADRLRREASRVSQLAALLAERESAVAERLSLEQRKSEQQREHEAATAEWHALWARVSISPRSPLESQELLIKVTGLREWTERNQQRQAQLAALQTQAAALRAALERGLMALGEPAIPAHEALASAALRAERVLQRAERGAIERSEREHRQASLGQAQRRAEQRLADAESARQAWHAQWHERMAQLRLRPAASVSEAIAVLDGLRRLFSKVDEIRKMQNRIDAMEADAKEFRRDVMLLMDRHLFELRELVLEEAAEELIRRYEKARSDLLQRQRIEADLGQALKRLDEIELARAAANEHLASLQRNAGVGDSEALERAERRSEEARSLARDLGETEDELLRHGEGQSLPELEAQAADAPRDRLRPRLVEIESELEELDESYKEVCHQVGRLEQGLQSLEQDERAAEAAAEAEQQLSLIKTVTRTFVRKKLAAELLLREIRRYREANQGPVISRASELFARLTLGQHQRLQVGFSANDEPVLLCVDALERQLQVDALSDGARDQLYLALRLASLERFAEHREPLPLLLDDVLIHFDDERARAALQVLCDFADTTQVLFFTHHARLLELARQALPPDRLVEHRLTEPERPARVVQPSPSPGVRT
jgi:uncharacterized protein YhaN